MIDNNDSNWDELLFDAVWAYRTSKRSSTGTTPYALVYGHDVVLPLEITVQFLRVARKNHLSHVEYDEAMMSELDDLDKKRGQALNSIILQKQKVVKAYNKNVNVKSFHEGEFVWKVILPLGTKDPQLGKWSPTWEGPFLISEILYGNAYKLCKSKGKNTYEV